MARRLNLWMDDIQKVKKLSVGDEFTVMKLFQFSSRNTSWIAQDHLDKHLPVGREFWVSEDLAEYSNSEYTQTGYAADSYEYNLLGWNLMRTTCRASNMPKQSSRFKVKAIKHEKIFNDSTSWFTVCVRFKLLESIS